MFSQGDLAKDTQTVAELRGMVRRLSRLLEISVTLNSTLDQERLLRFILETATDVLNCEAASILLFDENRGELYFAAATGSDPKKLAEIPVPLEGSIAGTIFREDRPLVINDVERDPRHFGLVGEQVKFQPHSLVGVPMRVREKSFGVLEALNKQGGRFTERDAQILFIIASQAAVAIHNARLLEALQRAYDELSQLDDLKSNFMAIASHELRTPLGLILGYATFLKEKASGELSDHAGMVLNSAMRMQSLVEDMTNMNLLKIGSTELDPKIFPLQQAVEAAHESVRSTAEAKNQHLTVDMPSSPLYISGDPDKLELVFINLLNNAIRYTPAHGRIGVMMYPQADEIWIETRDTGYGIPANELQTIFKEFYQVEEHMTRRYGGLGLGLAIAKGLVELHGGRIWAESEGTGQGSVFKIVLPRSRK
jgi:signal transduction histidine kinase